MPSDPFAKVNPGDPVVFSAIAWNAMLSVVRPNRKFGNLTGAEGLYRQSGIIRVQNTTGAALDRASVVGLGAPIFTPTDDFDTFMQSVTFKAVTPDIAKHKKRFAILLEPAPIDRVVRAFVAGVCPVKVDLVDLAHKSATVKNAQTGYLESTCHGHARILWLESDEAYSGYATGQQWAIVLLGTTGAAMAVGQANGDISPRSGSAFGTGQVDIYRNDGGNADGPIETIDVLNASASVFPYGAGINDGMWCHVTWDDDDTAWVVPIECP